MCTLCAANLLEAPDCPFASAPGTGTTIPSASPSEDLPWLTVDEVADYLVIGFWEMFLGRTSPFVFDLGPDNAITVDLTKLSAAGQTLARAALDAWTNVTGIAFPEIGPGAEIDFRDDQRGGFGGPVRVEDGRVVAAIVNVGENILARHGTEIGGRAYFFYLHEIGHALGLGHSGPYNVSARFGADATFANDSWQMTVMSYFEQDENPNVAVDFAYPLTPMPADITAVERLYGPPMVQEGDTIYGEGSTAAGPLGLFVSAPMPTTQTIVDSGGIDLIDLSGDASDMRLDLAPGSYSDVLGLIGNLAIARGTDIENARTGAGNDVVSGNALDNVIQTNGGDDTLAGGAGNDMLIGGAGDDMLIGGAGDDMLIGGAGSDTAAFSGPLAAYTVLVSASGVSVEDRRENGDGADTLSGVEHLDFADASWSLDIFAGGIGLSEDVFRELVEVYIAYFDRAPDAKGLFFYATGLARGVSLEDSARTFLASPEYAAAYPPGLSNEDFAREVYSNVLGRMPDPNGFDFWVRELDTGAVGRDLFVLELLRGVQPGGGDAAYLATKTDIGIYFAVTKGMSNGGNAGAAMDLFDGTPASIDAAVSAIDGFHTAALDAETGEFLLPLVGVVDDPFAA